MCIVQVNRLKVHMPLACGLFAVLCTHHLHVVPERLRHPERRPRLPVPPTQPLAAASLLSFLLDLPTWFVPTDFIERCNEHTTELAHLECRVRCVSTCVWPDERATVCIVPKGPLLLLHPCATRSLAATDWLSATMVFPFSRISHKWCQSVVVFFFFLNGSFLTKHSIYSWDSFFLLFPKHLPDPFGGDPFKESDPFRGSTPDDFFKKQTKSDPFTSDPFTKNPSLPSKVSALRRAAVP